MMNGAINLDDTIAPKAAGKTDVMEPLAVDANNNGIPDGADKYPTFLKEFFKGLQPRARLIGLSHIQGSWIALNFVFFEKGATVEIGQTTITFDATKGYPSITILQDPTAQGAPGAISDFCAPLFSQSITMGISLDNPCTPTRVEGANCPTGQDGPPQIKERGYPLFPCDTGNTLDEDGDGKINDGCPQRNNIPRPALSVTTARATTVRIPPLTTAARPTAIGAKAAASAEPVQAPTRRLQAPREPGDRRRPDLHHPRPQSARRRRRRHREQPRRLRPDTKRRVEPANDRHRKRQRQRRPSQRLRPEAG